MNEFLRKFSEQLKNLREEKNITLDQVNNKTRIDKKFLEAIEDGNFSVMPEVYMKAFLKEYANAIDEDPDEVLMKFERANSGKNYDEEEKVETIDQDEPKILETKIEKKEVSQQPVKETIKIEESSNRTLYYIIFAIILLLAIFVIYRTFLNEPENAIVTEKPFEDTLPQENNISENTNTSNAGNKVDQTSSTNDNSIKVNSELAQVQNNTKKLQLKITSDDNAWIRVIVDEKENSEFIMTKGMERTFNGDKQFFLHIGNSGAVKLFLNGKELEFNKAPNRVRKIIVDENGVRYIRRTSTTANEN